MGSGSHRRNKPSLSGSTSFRDDSTSPAAMIERYVCHTRSLCPIAAAIGSVMSRRPLTAYALCWICEMQASAAGPSRLQSRPISNARVSQCLVQNPLADNRGPKWESPTAGV